MESDAIHDMITALQSCGLTPLRLELSAGCDSVDLNESAASFLSAPGSVSISTLRNLGPKLNGAPLGARLADFLTCSRNGNDMEAIQCEDDERLLCFASASHVELFRIDPVVAIGARRELRHRLRNHVNTILMNAELLSMLANRAELSDMARAAQRVEDECREFVRSLEAL